MSEIADNKWEVEASKPPITTFFGIVQIALMSCFAALFAYIVIFSAVAIVTPKRSGGWEEKLNNSSAPAAATAPAVAAPAAAAVAAPAAAVAAPAAAAVAAPAG